ncbi:VOC family protein [Rhodococcus sp. HM1]|uniref:VOC family protein n=1 Tax=unclassified Rhodococcus (in: high G+C Gram-positive bacteria) TaxID=192944 RepID=UPI0018CC8E37|nr:MULTISPECIES: VOC family protein [unclassified Rhodococcus (in: high G+C Gram-positive bacteria)]MBH0123144.1 VOC family protein [Rhodococcus sp. CX]MCK8674433.1 VOC family protein [Rhodococcus sp. HM1]
MTPHLSAVGLVVSDLVRSFDCYRLLGLDLPTEPPDSPHFEVTLPGGLRLLWDTVESVRSFHPEFTPGTGGASLAFDCGSPDGVDATYKALLSASCTEVKAPWDAFWGQRYALVQDPDGHSIDLFAALS